jgi:hypothetical protein
MTNAPTPRKNAKKPKQPAGLRGTPKGQGVVVTANGGRIGNPRHIVTEDMRLQVQTLAKVTSQEHAAASLKISVDTLQRYYAKEWEAGLAEAIAAIGAKLLNKAMGGNLTAMIFFLRTRGKGAYSTRVEHTGIDGSALRTFDFSQLSEEDVLLFDAMCRRTIGIGPNDDIPAEFLPD